MECKHLYFIDITSNCDVTDKEQITTGILFQIYRCYYHILEQTKCEQGRKILFFATKQMTTNSRFLLRLTVASATIIIKSQTFCWIPSSSHRLPLRALPQDCFRSLALEEHQQEIATGFANFGRAQPVLAQKWTNEDFLQQSVGVGNAGPDEFLLDNGDKIFQTKQPVISRDECDRLVKEARESIRDGLKEPKYDMETTQPRNSQLGEARVSTLPMAQAWLESIMHNTLFPLLESRFGCKAEDLTLHDALIIGYGYFGTPTQAQPLHRDSSILSLNIALSPFHDYEGGGTYFQGLSHDNGQETIRNPQGHVMCHAGGVMHAGRSIDRGQRWVLVLFLLSSAQPQLARRCHAHGVRAKHAGNWQSAYQALQEGLQIAPNDHQLHLDMGGVFASRGNFAEARRRLALSSHHYKPCYKAAHGLARDLDNKSRTRAALRWFEISLSRIGESDLQPNAWAPLQAAGYDARVKAAQCAIVLSLRSPKFAKEYAPRAIDWINTSMQKEPNQDFLLDMVKVARTLADNSQS